MNRDTSMAFRESAQGLLGRHDQLLRLRALRGARPAFDRDMWREMAHAGWLSIAVPEDQGGLGLGLVEVAAIAEEAGSRLLPEPYIGAGVQSIAALCRLPQSALRDQLLADGLCGRRVIGLAWQEEAGELACACPTTVSTPAGETVSIHGAKLFAVPGTGADGWLVLTAEQGLPSLYWVPAAHPDLEIRDEQRVDGSTMCSIILQDVRVPVAHRLAVGAPARAAVEYANDAARIAQGAESLGVARRALEITVEHLKTRVQFGKAIGSFQALQHRTVDAYLHVELAAACIWSSIEAMAAGEDSIAAVASRIKARCADTALSVTRLAIQLHGAIGYTDEHDIGLYFKRALHLAGWLGSATAHSLRYLELQPPHVEPGAEESAVPERTRAVVDGWEAVDEKTFRQNVRAFLTTQYPMHLRHPARRLRWQEIKSWYGVLSRQGWIAPAWPAEFGGMGLPPDKLLAYFEEFERFGAARLPDQGLINLGPVLIRYGTPEQQAEFLPKILSGEHIWCQGYSEPDAGSDLASLRTEAMLENDEFIVTGQKIWTTLAQDATHIFMLVRTDRTVKKQEGISFLLVDLSSPGITVRPIENIFGDEEFCEVFFDGVRVPRSNLVGERNKGWIIAKALLGFERIFVGSPQQSQHALSQVRLLAAARGLFSDRAFAFRYAELLRDVADLSAVYTHFADIVKRGDPLPPSVSLLKIWASETYGRISMLLVEIGEEHGANVKGADFKGVHTQPLAPLMTAIITTIYAGTNEIQRNILSKQVLGLPT